jgi:hypothetical protein
MYSSGCHASGSSVGVIDLPWKYSFDLQKLQQAMISAGLPIQSISTSHRFEVVMTRQLTSAEKTALAKWCLGAWSALQAVTGQQIIDFVSERQVS